jgi:phosphonatase-like hydrolase
MLLDERPRQSDGQGGGAVGALTVQRRSAGLTLDIALVVFDMAGTTVKDGGEVPAAFSSALEAHGIVASADAIAGVRGASKRQAILEFMPDGPDRAERAAAAYDTFRERIASVYGDHAAAVDGATDVFATLRARGVRVALNTGFDRDITALLVGALGWSHGVVDAIVCGDDVAHGRPAPDLILRAMERAGVSLPERVMNVGDTVLDLQAAHNASVGCSVGVLSGAHDRARLERAPHTHIVNSIADIPSLCL